MNLVTPAPSNIQSFNFLALIEGQGAPCIWSSWYWSATLEAHQFWPGPRFGVANIKPHHLRMRRQVLGLECTSSPLLRSQTSGLSPYVAN